MTFKQRLQSGERLDVFALGRMYHSNLISLLGMEGGFDGFWLDLEHSPLTVRDVEVAAGVGRGYGLECFVRIAPTDYAILTRCLEGGASGVMAAQIHSAAQAEEVVQWAKFHPRGRRGLNPLGHDGRFGRTSLADFTARANQDAFLGVQIETAGAVEEVEAIAGVEGIDFLFVGPSDLGQALGVVGELTHPRCLEALDAVADACRHHGKRWGAVTPSPEYARLLLEKGCTLVSAVSDVRLVTAGLDSLREMFGPIG